MTVEYEEHRKIADAFAAQFPLFAGLKSKYGYPPTLYRPAGFATMCLIILEQQVSLASAKAVFDKLIQANPDLNPASFLKWSDEQLLQFGYSRQKRTYTRLMATAILDGNFDFNALADLDDAKAREYLIQLKGIGPWTADVYLLNSEKRKDIFPAGDLALQIGYQEQEGLSEKPSVQTLEAIAERWKPNRSMAAKWLWHAYLSDRGK